MSFGDVLNQMLAAVFGHLVNAIVVRWAAFWIAKEKPSYWKTYVSLLGGSWIATVVGFIAGAFDPSVQKWLPGGFLVIGGGCLMQATFLHLNSNLSFGNAFLALLITGLLWLVVVFAVFGAFILMR